MRRGLKGHTESDGETSGLEQRCILGKEGYLGGRSRLPGDLRKPA